MKYILYLITICIVSTLGTIDEHYVSPFLGEEVTNYGPEYFIENDGKWNADNDFNPYKQYHNYGHDSSAHHQPFDYIGSHISYADFFAMDYFKKFGFNAESADNLCINYRYIVEQSGHLLYYCENINGAKRVADAPSYPNNTPEVTTTQQ
uniref:Astacin domain-containing protein n=1 Tax=Parastrongyloides trichosuri TaxID=131310 RepID=A0A0N4ZQV8_PARTI